MLLILIAFRSKVLPFKRLEAQDSVQICIPNQHWLYKKCFQGLELLWGVIVPEKSRLKDVTEAFKHHIGYVEVICLNLRS